jgi:hypothetical protein
MKFAIDPEHLDIVKSEKIRDVDRYYQSLQCILGLRFYLEKNKDLKTRFIGAEVVLKRPNNDHLNPDMCLQICDDNSNILGVPIELKSSLSDEGDVFKNLQELERYNDKLSGWDTKSKYVEDEVTVLSPYLEDVGRVLRVLKESIKDKKLNFTKELLIWQWSLVPSLKNPNQENLLIQQIYGDLTSKKVSIFNKCISDGIKQDINEMKLIIEKERNLFTNQEPPVEYTMMVMWQNIFGEILNQKNNLVSVEEVVSIVNDFYTDSLMKNPNNEYKFKKDWAKKALEMLVNINMAKNKGDKYEIKLNCQSKNIKSYFCEKVASCQIKKGLHRDKLNKNKIKNLIDFKHKEKGLFEDENSQQIL